MSRIRHLHRWFQHRRFGHRTGRTLYPQVRGRPTCEALRTATDSSHLRRFETVGGTV